MAGPDGRCILFNSLRSCPFAREVAPFYVAIAMLLNTVTITLTSSPTSCFCICVFGDLQNISVHITGVTAPPSLKTMRKHWDYILHSTNVIMPIVQNGKDSFLNQRKVLAVDLTCFNCSVIMTGAFSPFNEQIRQILIDMLIESKLS